MSKSIREKVIRELYCMEQSTILCIADLGCSSSEENNLSVVYGLVDTIDKARRELGHGPQEYQIYLNDLPGNDFNTVFGSVTRFKDKLKEKMGDDFGDCFVNGVPGSFYGRLFPTNSLHFVHSSTSLHWLSQVPEGIEDNKRNIYTAKTSPPKVLKAYYDQFKKDFLMFLHCRSKEVVAGGKMVLTLLGRQNNDSCYSNKSGYMWELLAKVLDDMVIEGYIEEEKLNTFNLPIYTPSPSELEFLVHSEGSFALNQVHAFEISWDVNDHKNGNSCDQYDFVTCLRAVVEPLIISHFGEVIIDEIFKRFREIVYVSMANEKNMIANVTISLTRRSRG
ncbi:S-adenosyl-L-methionine:benzoic acid/salicylic acid carboxyl methyltransferase 3-like isoform X2 [Beta vulgaris subsp. vulgaris]|nr:S-adenosyl-L-methionine:benzoic acid/salicylic acid carboxyl methyltransferase 3-like isoform X2 [Beta vulgaris subsp. vulgaris]